MLVRFVSVAIRVMIHRFLLPVIPVRTIV